MQTFQNIGEAAGYLKNQSQGTQCVLQGGGRRNRDVVLNFHEYGLRVTAGGARGNRTITLRGPYCLALEAARQKNQAGYLQSGPAANPTPPTPFLVHGRNLPVGGAIVCTDESGKAVRRNATRTYGAWTTTVHKVNGGWEVKRLSATPNPDLFPKTRGSAA